MERTENLLEILKASIVLENSKRAYEKALIQVREERKKIRAILKRYPHNGTAIGSH